AFERADVKRVLRHAIAGAFALEFAMGLLVELGLLERCHLRLGQHKTLLGALGLERLEALLHRLQIVPEPHAAHAERRNGVALFFEQLATHTWPKAGLSIAISTTAFSIAGSTRFFSSGLRRVISASARSPPFS